MALLDLHKLTIGLSRTWAGYLRDWDRPRGTYHWNELSASRIEEMLSRRFSDVEVTHIRSFLKQRFDYGHYYNVKAYTIIAQGTR